MEGPRACKREERNKVIELINKTFREPGGYKSSMGEEFILLLGEENLDNMRIITEDGVPVADVNFYKSTILIEGIPVKAASIGAVCTAVNSRGKGYSSLLLDDCEGLMKEDNIRIMLVSGTRELYLRRGCCLVGSCYEFTIDPSEEVESIEVIELEDELFEEMIKLYSMEATRFYRTHHEFKYLLKGATTGWGSYSYKSYLIKEFHEYSSYVVLRIIHDEDGDWGEVVEAAGNREVIYKSFERLRRLNSLKYIKYTTVFNDESTEFLLRKNKAFVEFNLSGSLKILNFTGLMMDLMPYFAQYVDKEIIDNIRFYEQDGKYIFQIKDEIIEINDLKILTELIFGTMEGMKIVDPDKPNLIRFINSVFPLPFVWPGNLNYQ
jgi:hypothetical protein